MVPTTVDIELARDEAERAREEHRVWLRGPSSYLAAVARRELPIGETLRLEGHVIEALPDGFRIDSEPSGPRTINVGRYRLRLSHQNAPAVVVRDAEAPKDDLVPEWFPYDPAFRYILALEPDRADLAIGSTREHDRAATRAGSLRFAFASPASRPMRSTCTSATPPAGASPIACGTSM